MTSNSRDTEAYVWVWLQDKTEPVVAGRLTAANDQLVFNYGRSYLARDDAIPLYEPELPLNSGALPLLNNLSMPNCIRDAAPDAWGRRVIINRTMGGQERLADTDSLDEITYLLESGSDRIGALDFQTSATEYVPREPETASLEGLMQAAENVEKGIPLPAALDNALLHGSSIGGARPKAMLVSEDRKYIAKFSSQNDLYNVVKAEYVAMRLAAASGINAATVQLRHTAGKDVLLIERFDRAKVETGWQRRLMVSALTMLELEELMARYASYEDLATIIRHRFANPRETLQELFARMTFNILCGNTDDHARNHAAFWNGQQLELTPAYDICPQARTGSEASQAMLISGNNNLSRITLCLEAAPSFLLSIDAAIEIVGGQLDTIVSQWDNVTAEASLTEVDRERLWRRQFLNPYALEGAPQILTERIK